jgi:hypothetical protein
LYRCLKIDVPDFMLLKVQKMANRRGIMCMSYRKILVA